MAIEIAQGAGSGPAFAYAPGWAPATITDRGAAACRLIAFRDAFEALSLADRAWFAEELAELLGDACLADAALDAVARR